MTRARRAGDDTGASLTIALVLITVFAVLIAVTLTFADTSLRTTLALRSAAADDSTVDGAAEAALNAIRLGSYTGGSGDCFGSGSTLTLGNFHQPATGAADSAAVTCEHDAVHSAYSPVAITNRNRLPNAVLTTAGLVPLEAGFTVDVNGGGDLKVHGPVFSHSTVAASAGSLTVDASLRARGACSGTVLSTPPPACNLGSSLDPAGDVPNFPPAAGPATPRTGPSCPASSGQLFEFQPGLYTDPAALNLYSRCPNSTYYFHPGTYYFNFPANVPWTIVNGYVIAGQATVEPVAGTPPTFPGACRSPVPPVPVDPSWTPPAAGQGVQFVFAGGSRLVLSATRAEICGNYSADEPPIAVYGLKTAISPSIPAQSGCVVALPYPGTGCPMLSSVGDGGQLYVQGTVYAPNAVVDVDVANPSGPIFASAVVARGLHITTLAGTNLTQPLVRTPDLTPLGRRTALLLTVYLCPATPTCTPGSGTARLRAKVGVVDPSGTPVPGARQVIVYSWAPVQ